MNFEIKSILSSDEISQLIQPYMKEPMLATLVLSVGCIIRDIDVFKACVEKANSAFKENIVLNKLFDSIDLDKHYGYKDITELMQKEKINYVNAAQFISLAASVIDFNSDNKLHLAFKNVDEVDYIGKCEMPWLMQKIISPISLDENNVFATVAIYTSIAVANVINQMDFITKDCVIAPYVDGDKIILVHVKMKDGIRKNLLDKLKSKM